MWRLDAVSFMRTRVRGTPSWPGRMPRDRIRWRRPVRAPRINRLPRGGPYVFERLDGLPILRRVTRAGADVGEAELVQDLAHRALVVGDAEALGDEVLQVDSAPAHDPMHRPIRAGLDEARQVCLLIGRQARWAACPPPILKPVRPAVVEA